MIPFQTVNNPLDPRVAPFYQLKKGALLAQMGEGYFVAETFKVVRLLLESSISVVSIFATAEWYEKLAPYLSLQDLSSDQLLCASKEEMEKIVGFNIHQGIMAIGKRPDNIRVQELGNKVLAFNNVVNPENVGAIVRTAVGLGFQSVLADFASADPYLRRAVRVSMGHAFRLQCHRTRRLDIVFQQLKDLGYRIIGSDVRVPNVALPKYKFPEKFVLTIGSEVNGMDPKILELCDDIIHIPTADEGFAYNASHAAAIMLSHAAFSSSGPSRF